MKMLGERLKTARIRRKMTQEQLGMLINTSRSTISNWERGETQPDYEQLYALTEVLCCDFLDYSKRTRAMNPANTHKLRLNFSVQPIIEVISDGNTCELLADAIDFRIIGSDQRGNPVEIHAYADFSVNSDGE